MYAWLSIAALTLDNIIADFVLHSNTISVVMFIVIWYFFGSLFGNILCLWKKKPYLQNFRELKKHKLLTGVYIFASMVSTFLWMQSISMVGIGDVVLLIQATVLIPIFAGVFYF